MMTDLRIEDPTPEEIEKFEHHQRVLDVAVKRGAEARSQARADAKAALLAQLEINKTKDKLK